MLTPTNFGRCVAVKIRAEKRAAQFKQAEGPGLLDNYGHYFYDSFIGAPSRALSNFYEWGTTPIGTNAYARANNLTHLPRKQQADAYLASVAKNPTASSPSARASALPPLEDPGWWHKPVHISSNQPSPVRMGNAARLFLEDYWRRLSGNALGRGTAAALTGAGKFIDTATEPNLGEKALSTAVSDVGKDIGAAASSAVSGGGKTQASSPPPASSFWDSITQTATDTGKKFQELMTDRRYAPLIALPALGLGAYGLYDLLRDKKRRKRPKFYDENAREF